VDKLHEIHAWGNIIRLYLKYSAHFTYVNHANRELEEMNKGENIVKWIKGQRISWLGHLERMEEVGYQIRSSLKNWRGRDEEEDPGKDGEKK
jgi:hypothetical protein